jgi:hypothetical protein
MDETALPPTAAPDHLTPAVRNASCAVWKALRRCIELRTGAEETASTPALAQPTRRAVRARDRALDRLIGLLASPDPLVATQAFDRIRILAPLCLPRLLVQLERTRDRHFVIALMRVLAEIGHLHPRW